MGDFDALRQPGTVLGFAGRARSQVGKVNGGKLDDAPEQLGEPEKEWHASLLTL